MDTGVRQQKKLFSAFPFLKQILLLVVLGLFFANAACEADALQESMTKHRALQKKYQKLKEDHLQLQDNYSKLEQYHRQLQTQSRQWLYESIAAEKKCATQSQRLMTLQKKLNYCLPMSTAPSSRPISARNLAVPAREETTTNNVSPNDK